MPAHYNVSTFSQWALGKDGNNLNLYEARTKFKDNMKITLTGEDGVSTETRSDGALRVKMEFEGKSIDITINPIQLYLAVQGYADINGKRAIPF